MLEVGLVAVLTRMLSAETPRPGTMGTQPPKQRWPVWSYQSWLFSYYILCTMQYQSVQWHCTLLFFPSSGHFVNCSHLLLSNMERWRRLSVSCGQYDTLDSVCMPGGPWSRSRPRAGSRSAQDTDGGVPAPCTRSGQKGGTATYNMAFRWILLKLNCILVVCRAH